MDFEKIAIENADTVEEYRESLQAVCSDRGLSASRLKKMTQMLVGVDDLPKLDSAEQARRRNVSQRMQEKMTTWLVDNFESKNRRGRTDYEAIGDRRLTSDFLLQLPHPEQDEEFARRAQILRSGTPQEKTDLFFQVLFLRSKSLIFMYEFLIVLAEFLNLSEMSLFLVFQQQN